MIDAIIIKFASTIAASQGGSYMFWQLAPEGGGDALYLDPDNDLLGNMQWAGDGAAGLNEGASTFEHVFDAPSTSEIEALQSASHLDFGYTAWGDIFGGSVTVEVFSETNGRRVLVGEGTFTVVDGQGSETFWRVPLSWTPPPPPARRSALYKRVERSFAPGSPGVTANPGRPYIGARWVTLTRTRCSYGPDVNLMLAQGWRLVPNYSGVSTTPNGTFSWVPPGTTGMAQSSNPYAPNYSPISGGGSHSGWRIPYVNACRTETYQQYVPAQSYVAPTPGRAPVPAQTLLDYNIGWTGRARSIKAFSNAGEARFKVPASVSGAVVGLNTGFRPSGYADIKYAFYCTQGVARIVESGVVQANLGAYAEGAEFRIRRYDGKITYWMGGAQVREVPNNSDPMHLDAALYTGEDSVYDPAITGLSFSHAAFEPMRTMASDYVFNSSLTSFLPMTTQIRQASRSHAKFEPMITLASNKVYGESRAKFLPMTTLASAGGLAPSYALSNASFVQLTGAGSMLTGEIGGAMASFAPLVTLSSGGTAVGTETSSTVTNPDGSTTTTTVTNDASGTTTTETTTTTNPDGSVTVVEVVVNADGSTTTTTTVTHPDGSITIVSETVNSESEVIDSSTGTGTTTTNPDGSTTVVTVVTDANGNTTTTTTTTTTNPDGSTTVVIVSETVDSTGDVTDSSTSTSTTVTSGDTSTTTTTTTDHDGNTTTTVTGSTTNPDGSTSSVITSPVTYGESTTQFLPMQTSGRMLFETEAFDVGLFSAAFAGTMLQTFSELAVAINSSGQITSVFAFQTLASVDLTSTAEALSISAIQAILQAVMFSHAAMTSTQPMEDHGATVWVANAESGGITRYENYGFNSFAKIGDTYYGAKADGLYALDGETDQGEAVQAMVSFGKQDFGTTAMKSVSNAYLGCSSAGNLFVKVLVRGEEYIYTARSSSDTMQTQRVDIGRGIRANFIEFELYNADGDDFELASVEFLVAPLNRRI